MKLLLNLYIEETNIKREKIITEEDVNKIINKYVESHTVFFDPDDVVDLVFDILENDNITDDEREKIFEISMRAVGRC